MASAPVGKPRGLLRGPAGEGTFAHDRCAPAAELAPFVEHFWTVAWECTGGPVVREVLPHPSVHVVFERGRSAVAGVPRGRFTRRLEGRGVVFGIKFRPGCFRPFVRFPVARLTGRELPIDEVLGPRARGLEERVLAEPAMASMVATATAFLSEALPARDPRADEAAAAVKRILDDRAMRRVDDVARACGSSPRALQRLFSEYVGVSPKWVIRRYRLHEAVERTNAGTVVDWPGLALELGYYDQAHFVRDFKALVGRSPGDYERFVRGAAAATRRRGGSGA